MKARWLALLACLSSQALAQIPSLQVRVCGFDEAWFATKASEPEHQRDYPTSKDFARPGLTFRLTELGEKAADSEVLRDLDLSAIYQSQDAYAAFRQALIGRVAVFHRFFPRNTEVLGLSRMDRKPVEGGIQRDGDSCIRITPLLMRRADKEMVLSINIDLWERLTSKQQAAIWFLSWMDEGLTRVKAKLLKPIDDEIREGWISDVARAVIDSADSAAMYRRFLDLSGVRWKDADLNSVFEPATGADPLLGHPGYDLYRWLFELRPFIADQFYYNGLYLRFSTSDAKAFEEKLLPAARKEVAKLAKHFMGMKAEAREKFLESIAQAVAEYWTKNLFAPGGSTITEQVMVDSSTQRRGKGTETVKSRFLTWDASWFLGLDSPLHDWIRDRIWENSPLNQAENPLK